MTPPAFRTLIAFVAIDVFGEVHSIARRTALSPTASDRPIVVFDSSDAATIVTLPNAGTVRVDVNGSRALRIDDSDVAFFELDLVGVDAKRRGGSRSAAPASAAPPSRRITVGAIIGVDIRIDISPEDRPARSQWFAISNWIAAANWIAP